MEPKAAEKELIARLSEAVRGVYGTDSGLIDHAEKVFAHAMALLEREPGDRKIVIAAALLHDIGIGEARKKYNSAAGEYQELEGPPIARGILERIGMDGESVDHVCRIIANHHSARDIDTPEFRIIWDSDWLVNMPGAYPKAEPTELSGRIDEIFRTKTGAERARGLFCHVKA